MDASRTVKTLFIPAVAAGARHGSARQAWRHLLRIPGSSPQAHPARLCDDGGGERGRKFESGSETINVVSISWLQGWLNKVRCRRAAWRAGVHLFSRCGNNSRALSYASSAWQFEVRAKSSLSARHKSAVPFFFFSVRFSTAKRLSFALLSLMSRGSWTSSVRSYS